MKNSWKEQREVLRHLLPGREFQAGRATSAEALGQEYAWLGRGEWGWSRVSKGDLGGQGQRGIRATRRTLAGVLSTLQLRD